MTLDEPTEMELRVAKAIVKALHLNAFVGVGEIAIARAAIGAMREPTATMQHAGSDAWPSDETFGMYAAIYNAMIDSASPPRG